MQETGNCLQLAEVVMSTDTTGPCSSTDGNRHRKCADPFKCHKQLNRTGLRAITSPMIQLHPALQPGDRLCNQCQKKILGVSQALKRNMITHPQKETLNP